MRTAARISLVWCLATSVFVGACSGDDTGASAGDADPFGNAGDDGDAAASGDEADTTASGDNNDDDDDAAGSNDASGGDEPADNGPAGGDPGAVPGGFIPMFPGAGSDEASQPLQNGGLCDYVEGDPLPTAGDVTRCFFGADKMNPAATIEQVLECAEGVDTLHLRLTFDPAFVDNTYGVNSIGWENRKKGHTFKDLVGSDHAELLLMDSDGNVAAQFKLDYLSEDPDAPSGHASLGVTGGDGEMIVGDSALIVDASSSMDRNLNERGYDTFTTDSPVTDADYTPDPAAPDWDYRVVYEVWIDLAAFGDAEFEGAFIEVVHASPSKDQDNTIEVTPSKCPPNWDPGCDDPDGCEDEPPGDDECVPEGPDDNSCGDSGEVPPGGEPAFCDRFPTDPSCRVD